MSREEINAAEESVRETHRRKKTYQKSEPVPRRPVRPQFAAQGRSSSSSRIRHALYHLFRLFMNYFKEICAPDAVRIELIPVGCASREANHLARISMWATSPIDAPTARRSCWNRKPKQERGYAALKSKVDLRRRLRQAPGPPAHVADAP
ncbi:hypothetical protein L596_030692 [Steinernema carpocapsae]|uniref:Uncharacterized protein n=1 Tax=Steinernema carpocapsae TaxID=34508 RepID=A0A4V5ZWT2_STECR|nr:hypothetical protein L596_030692 [Steinernema carpocapsae]